MKQSLKFIALGLVTLAAACGSKGDVATSPPDTTVTPPPPPGPQPPPPPPVGGPVNVFAAGNISKCSNGNSAATARLIDTSAAAVLTLGNAADSGTAADYGCFDATWGKFKSLIHPAIGNHDYLVDANGQPYFNYFGAAAGTVPDGWYSFDVGTWHVVVLNTELGGNSNVYRAGSDQQKWLAADLSAHANAKCTLAMWHRPRFLSSTTPGYVENTTLQSTWSLLEANHADVILNAGQYFYERMAPLTAAGVEDSTKGMLQFNVGLGGESAAQVPTTISPHSKMLDDNFGVLELTLRDGAYDWKYLNAATGAADDAGTGTCH